MKQRLIDILGLLSAAPDGLTAEDIRARLRPVVSQPTLSRDLKTLRGRGLVRAEGRARATRYHASSRIQLADLRSRRMHERVAENLVRDPGLLDVARQRLGMLRTVNPHGRIYLDRWQALMDEPLPRLLKAMTEDSESADAMRKDSPFTVLITAEDRQRVFESLRAH
jgi:DNA-binding transcriptional ArsR family regulator